MTGTRPEPITYKRQIAEMIVEAMIEDESIYVLGEGVADPKGIFGTTLLANQAFPDRVVETPLSETMLTGALAGMAAEGMKPVYVHARAEFSLLGLEHMINTIDKWPYLHNGQVLPIVVRMLVGRGWGQGPTHSQSFHHIFTNMHDWDVHYPVTVSGVANAYDIAFEGRHPTIIIEPRRVYDLSLETPNQRMRPDVQILTIGDCFIEALEAARHLQSSSVSAHVYPFELLSHGIPANLQVPTLIVDTANTSYVLDVAYEFQAKVNVLTSSPIPCPTSYAGERFWYPDVANIVEKAAVVAGKRRIPYTEESTKEERDGRREAF